MHIYVKELTLDKANIISSCRFLNLDILTRVYDKRDDFSFPIVNFLFFWMMTFPSYGLYISHLVRFPRICNNVFDFNDRNLIITEKLFHQEYRFHQLLKTFTKLYYRYTDLVYTYNSTCKNMIKKDIYH